MNLGAYADLWAIKPVRQLLIAALFARIPHTAAALVLALHVVEELDRSYAAAGLVAAVTTIGAAVGAPWRGRRRVAPPHPIFSTPPHPREWRKMVASRAEKQPFCATRRFGMRHSVDTPPRRFS